MWSRDGDEMVFDNRDNPFHYILSAIHLTEQYARELGKPLGLYRLSVDSDLDSIDGKKYGLGSSAAVTVATVKALNQFYELKMTNDKLYKLAAIAHLDIQGNGSLGDIAASVYGGWIAYQSFDKTWLSAERRLHSLKELLDMVWPELSVELLTAPPKMSLLIGWTGSPASTSQLVDKITIARRTRKNEYSQFLFDSRTTVTRMIQGFRQASTMMIQAGVRANRTLLRQLSGFSGVDIETTLLAKLCDTAELFHGAAKSSGAGGGDCGIAIVDEQVEISDLLMAWKAQGIEVLRFQVHEIRD